MTCQNCGAQIRAGRDLCPKCGDPTTQRHATSDTPATIKGCSTDGSASMTSVMSRPSANASPKAATGSTTPTNKKTSSPTWSPNAGNSASDTNQAASASAPTPAPSSPAESATTSDNVTGAPPGSSKTTPTTDPALSWCPSTIPWHTLTEDALATIQQIVIPISCGYSEREVAKAHGQPTRWVTGRLEKLRNELLAA